MHMRLKQLLISLAALILISAANPPVAVVRGKPGTPQTGRFMLTFTKQNPLSNANEVVRRTDLSLHETDPSIRDYPDSELEHIQISWRYDLAKHPFDIVVPAAY